MPECRHHRTRGLANHAFTHWNITPAKNLQTLLTHNLFNGRGRLGGSPGITWEKTKSCAVRTSGRQLKSNHRAEEFVRNLNENSCPVTSVGLCAGCTAVLHVAQRVDSVGNDRVTLHTFDMRDEPNATGVMFKTWVIQTVRRGVQVERHEFLHIQRMSC